jgi:hypothetical protein
LVITQFTHYQLKTHKSGQGALQEATAFVERITNTGRQYVSSEYMGL